LVPVSLDQVRALSGSSEFYNNIGFERPILSVCLQFRKTMEVVRYIDGDLKVYLLLGEGGKVGI
jgi:hypothetical protein